MLASRRIYVKNKNKKLKPHREVNVISCPRFSVEHVTNWFFDLVIALFLGMYLGTFRI